MNASRARLPLAATAAVALAATAHAQAVRIVSAAGDENFADLPEAISAADEGDLLLVAEGDYSAFTIDGKSLAIFAVPGADVRIDNWVTVRNLDEAQSVLLVGLEASNDWNTGSYAILSIEDCLGYVRLQDCEILGGDMGYGTLDCIPFDGGPAASIRDCSGVTLVDCELLGTKGMDQDTFNGGCWGGLGGAGLFSLRSAVALYECDIAGGQGGHAKYHPGAGGTGVEVDESVVFASGVRVLGGYSGTSAFSGYNSAGGDALRLSAGGTYHVLDGGMRAGFGLPVGQLVTGTGLYDPIAGSARSILALPIVPAGRALEVTSAGGPGDVVWQLVSTSPGHTLVLAASGVCLVPFPPALPASPAGVIAGSGLLQARLELPDLAPGSAHATYVVQGLHRTPAGERFLASARHVLALSPTVGPDCNGNGLSDYLDVVLGLSPDANSNLVPDECDP